ncbi:MAG: hypothetical protein CVU89_15795 [Firmicutes bacterium HGW-Firmicutes-14]|jgi:anti-sigma factor RsiW|nr:MAG: hypothetical protein CVU89_15795 [Firmicutes bacterium HGW-Firmicutes-14]
MDCRDIKKKIPEYLSGSLSGAEKVAFEAHLNLCPSCRREAESFRELDPVIDAADLEIPFADLTADIMNAVRKEARKEAMPTGPVQDTRNSRTTGISRTRGNSRGRIISLMQDLSAAAAAAIILFWFSGTVLAGTQVPEYSRGVARVTGSVGTVVQTYIDLSASTVNRLSDSVKSIELQMKGDEEL